MYEPLVACVDGHPHVTSQAAQPQAESLYSEPYHRDCFDARANKGREQPRA